LGDPIVPEGELTTQGVPARADTVGAGAIARPIIAALLVAAGVVHLVMVPAHAGVWMVEGVGLAVTGWLQLAGAVLVLLRCRRWVLWLIVIVNVAAVVLWAWSRTAGFPIGPEAGVAEAAGTVDRITAMAEASAVGFAAVLLVVRETRGSVAELAWRMVATVAVLSAGATTIALAAPSARGHVHLEHDAAAETEHVHDATTPTAANGTRAAGALQAGDATTATPNHAHTATTAANDKGFSLLMNGHQHSQTPQPIDAVTTAVLAHQLARTSELVARYPTVAAAEAAGYTRNGPFSPGLGAHYGKGIDTYIPGGVIDDTTILKPMLIYDGTDPDARLVGFMYMGSAANGGPPEGFAGPNDVWHYHTNTCLVVHADGTTDAPLGADSENVDPKLCQSLGGFLIENTGYMLHVWTVPGWENPLGVFHETHPAITCADGTYWTKPADRIGSSLSTCRDAP
jgi:hypothetical protein